MSEVATGDLVRLDAGGRLVLLGRKKDMILRDGYNIYPSLYEPAVAALPGVAEAAFIGLPDPDTGDEEVVLAVVPEDDAAGIDLDRLRAALPAIVDTGAVPDRIEVLDAFPRAGRAAKLDRAALRAAVRPLPGSWAGRCAGPRSRAAGGCTRSAAGPPYRRSTWRARRTPHGICSPRRPRASPTWTR